MSTPTGVSGWQILRDVELPLAAPMIIIGLRLAAVQVVGTATIATLIGGGGLGRFVVDGLAHADVRQVAVGRGSPSCGRPGDNGRSGLHWQLVARQGDPGRGRAARQRQRRQDEGWGRRT